MKKIILVLFVSLMTLSVSAQDLMRSKLFDNTFIGINAGVGNIVKSNNNDLRGFGNDKSFLTIGANFGKWITPSFGGEFTYDYGFKQHNTFGNSSFLGANLLLNMSNAIGGYKGEPRIFEFVPFIGGGWYHTHTIKTNNIAARGGLKIVTNIDNKKSLQINLVPSINYVLTDNGIYSYPTSQPRFDINRSWLSLQVGITYKFKTSNKTHNFKYSDKKYTQEQMDVYIKNTKDLMDDINKLRDLSDKNAKENASLKQQLKDANNQNKILSEKLENVTHCSVSTIGFEIGKDKILNINRSNILNIVEILTNEKDSKVILTGFADVKTGSKTRNMKLSISRAEEVKKALMDLGIDENRIEVVGMGDEIQPFGENLANRVVVSVIKY